MVEGGVRVRRSRTPSLRVTGCVASGMVTCAVVVFRRIGHTPVVSPGSAAESLGQVALLSHSGRDQVEYSVTVYALVGVLGSFMMWRAVVVHVPSCQCPPWRRSRRNFVVVRLPVQFEMYYQGIYTRPT